MTRREKVVEIMEGLIRDGVWEKLDWVSLCWLNAHVTHDGPEGYEITLGVLPEESNG